MLDNNNNNNELENYGVWVKSGPEDIIDEHSDPAPEEFELTDLDNESIENNDDFLLTEEEENLLGSLEDNSEDNDEELYDIQDLQDIDRSQDAEDEEFIDIDIPDSVEAGYSRDMDRSGSYDKTSGSDSQNSIKLLTEIANDLKNDLSAIKSELSELKKELSHYKIEEETSEIKPDEVPPGGFFSDDGDETIALTGDELDNIFNTAEITEEEITDEEQADISESDEMFSDSLEETAFEENKDELNFLDGNINTEEAVEKKRRGY